MDTVRRLVLHADVWRLACDELHVAKQRGNEHTRRTLLAAMTEPFDLICDVDLFITYWHQCLPDRPHAE